MDEKEVPSRKDLLYIWRNVLSHNSVTTEKFFFSSPLKDSMIGYLHLFQMKSKPELFWWRKENIRKVAIILWLIDVGCGLCIIYSSPLFNAGVTF